MAHPTRGVYQPSDLCPRDDRLTGTRRPLGAFPSLFQATCEAPGHVGHHSYRISYSFQHRCTLPPLADAGRTHTTFAPPQWGPPNRAGRTGRLPKRGPKTPFGSSRFLATGARTVEVLSDGGGEGPRLASYIKEIISGKSK